ncbi:MAG: hypothetical protein QM736_07830 [Vicinamibacterales bacterium]
MALGLLLILASSADATGLLDPLLRFRQLRTAHFIIYFHQAEEPLAARLATIVETSRENVARALGLESASAHAHHPGRSIGAGERVGDSTSKEHDPSQRRCSVGCGLHWTH